jgi:hypothetical protein
MIVGPGVAILSISGDNLRRVLHIFAGKVHVSHLTINDGHSNSGGGISIDETGSLSLTDSIIRNNFANIGGGIDNLGSLTITNVLIVGNSSDLWGGGIFNSGIFSAYRSTISNNTAISGGGLLNAVTLFSYGQIQAGTAHLENVTVSGNTASDFGGGIVSSGTTIGGKVTSTSLVLANCTLSNNSASTGGGLFNQFGTASVLNTIIANRLSGGNCNSMITSLGHNLESGNTCGFTGAGDLINTDPLLGPLADNGGRTMTHALLTGSPAIDTADPTTFPATDQRGVARPQGKGPDIGAYEYAEATSVPTMTEWGVIIFIVLAGLVSVYCLRRQNEH